MRDHVHNPSMLMGKKTSGLDCRELGGTASKSKPPPTSTLRTVVDGANSSVVGSSSSSDDDEHDKKSARVHKAGSTGDNARVVEIVDKCKVTKSSTSQNNVPTVHGRRCVDVRMIVAMMVF